MKKYSLYVIAVIFIISFVFYFLDDSQYLVKVRGFNVDLSKYGKPYCHTITVTSEGVMSTCEVVTRLTRREYTLLKSKGAILEHWDSDQPPSHHVQED